MTDEHTYTGESVGTLDANGLTGPPTRDGCLYLATRVQRLGIKDRLRSIHATPEDAYRAVVEHVGHEPEDDYNPEFPDGDWGEQVWGWHDAEMGTYLIQQFRWSGLSDEPAAFPSEPEVRDAE